MNQEYDIAIIIPMLNEQENIEWLVSGLNKYIATLTGLKIEILFVDDGSSDGTLAALKNANHVSYKARIIKLSKNFGSHAALRAGILNSNAKLTTFMYADLQDPLELVLKLYNKCKEYHDIVWATRTKIKVGLFQRIFSRLYAELMRKFVARNFPENGFDIVMFNEKVKNELNQNIESNSSIFIQILTLGFKQDSFEYSKSARKFGKSKWTWSKKIKLVIDSFVAYSDAPIRLVSIMGFALAFMGLIWALYIVMRYFILHDLNQGWPTLISVLLMGFGVTNISLGIIAEYLWRTLDVSRKRKVFVIDEIIAIGNE